MSAAESKPSQQRQALVRYLDETEALECPFGNTRRVVTDGLGGIANVHVIRVTRGAAHLHRGYDETYYVLTGRGNINLAGKDAQLRPGAVVTIPAGVVHSLQAEGQDPLEFIIFGTPPMSIDDHRARPVT
jgi:mannose-6-phosphate isomerase-like protein (cupin superfamily)